MDVEVTPETLSNPAVAAAVAARQAPVIARPQKPPKVKKQYPPLFVPDIMVPDNSLTVCGPSQSRLTIARRVGSERAENAMFRSVECLAMLESITSASCGVKKNFHKRLSFPVSAPPHFLQKMNEPEPRIQSAFSGGTSFPRPGTAPHRQYRPAHPPYRAGSAGRAFPAPSARRTFPWYGQGSAC